MGAHRFPFRASSLNDLCCCVLVGIHDLLPSIDESTSILFYTRPYPMNRGTREREHCTYVVNLINFRECRVLEVPGVEWLPETPSPQAVRNGMPELQNEVFFRVYYKEEASLARTRIWICVWRITPFDM